MRFYKLARLIQAYRDDNPKLSYAQAERLARRLRRMLDSLDRSWTYRQKRYHAHGDMGDPERHFGEKDF